MNRVDRARLLGMAIGDGCLKLKSRDYVEFAIDHTGRQLPYLQHKRDVMHSIVGGKQIRIHPQKITLKNGKSYRTYRFSKQHPYFKQLRRWLYNEDGIKVVTPQILSYLTPESLAYWYMDDGSLVVNQRKDGSISSFEVRLYTYCSQQEVLDIKKWFKDTYDIEVKTPKYGKKEQWNVRMNTKNGKKFLDLVKPYMVDCMAYKSDVLSKTRVRNISYRDDDIV